MAKTHRMPPGCHKKHLKTMPLYWIHGPMNFPTSLRTYIKQTNRYSIRPLLSSRAQKRLTLRYTRVQTHNVPNEPREKRLYHSIEYKRLHRIPQTRHRLLMIYIIQQLTSSNKIHSQLMDNQHIEIPLQEKKGNWRKYPKYETPIPKILTYHGRLFQERNSRGRTCITE